MRIEDSFRRNMASFRERAVRAPIIEVLDSWNFTGQKLEGIFIDEKTVAKINARNRGVSEASLGAHSAQQTSPKLSSNSLNEFSARRSSEHSVVSLGDNRMRVRSWLDDQEGGGDGGHRLSLSVDASQYRHQSQPSQSQGLHGGVGLDDGRGDRDVRAIATLAASAPASGGVLAPAAVDQHRGGHVHSHGQHDVEKGAGGGKDDGLSGVGSDAGDSSAALGAVSGVRSPTSVLSDSEGKSNEDTNKTSAVLNGSGPSTTTLTTGPDAKRKRKMNKKEEKEAMREAIAETLRLQEQLSPGTKDMATLMAADKDINETLKRWNRRMAANKKGLNVTIAKDQAPSDDGDAAGQGARGNSANGQK
eukprot:Opistho-2@32753